MVDLDSNPTKLIEVVEIGKQLLITRGALTTFSIANDVAKYFAILPAIFAATYVAAGAPADGPLDELNVMDLGTPESAIISAIIFNALIIPLLVPLALRGVRYRAIGASGAAAAQHAHLRPRRPDRPVHRDQAGRPGRPQPARRLERASRSPMARAAAVATRSSSGWRPGSGKTYRMLQEGRAEAEAGRDVVIAYLEPHGRAETDRPGRGPRAPAARAGRLPRARCSRRWTCRRSSSARPDAGLIDELAHTNAPGLEHAKRYEDIDDVLDAGIDVFSTVNVQHLESLNDQVAELTGVRVRETFPDSVLTAADEVVLIDLTPEALIERLRAGKIYPAERIEASLNNFFRIENLATLRELALRQVAEEVEAKARAARRAAGRHAVSG